jgi:hypothetical protein
VLRQSLRTYFVGGALEESSAALLAGQQVNQFTVRGMPSLDIQTSQAQTWPLVREITPGVTGGHGAGRLTTILVWDTRSIPM